MTRPPRTIEPLVPQLPTDETPTTATDGGRNRPFDYDRQPDTTHSPVDRHREEIEPLVPDLR